MRADMAGQLGLEVSEVSEERLASWTNQGWYAAEFAEAWAADAGANMHRIIHMHMSVPHARLRL